jgi:hypothetical protein
LPPTVIDQSVRLDQTIKVFTQRVHQEHELPSAGSEFDSVSLRPIQYLGVRVLVHP